MTSVVSLCFSSFVFCIIICNINVRSELLLQPNEDELTFPAVKSLPVPLEFILFLGESFANHSENHCSRLYALSLHYLFGDNLDKAALFKAYFSSYVVTSTMDNVTLEHWKMMARDYQCKMNHLTFTHDEVYNTQYCAYSVWAAGDPALQTNGFMYGFCLPSICSQKDISRILPALRHYKRVNATDLQEEITCVAGYQTWSLWAQPSVITILVIILLLAVVLLLCTICDAYKKQQPDNTSWKIWLIHFSLIRSKRRLLTNIGSSTSIGCLHGIRVVTMALIILSHLVCFSQSFISNSADLISDYRSNVLALFLYNGTYRVATFFVISGTLLSYSMLSRTRHHRNGQQKINWKFYLFTVLNRYLRLLPVYAFVIAFTVGLFPYLSKFPAWYVVDPLRQCSGNWWKNLLYINNLYHVQLCMSWTWYLASDFQLFLFHFPLVILLLKRPRLATLIVVVFLFCSMLLKAALVYINDYPPSLMLLVPIFGYNQDIASYTFDIYMKPYGWWGSYLIGMYFGYILFGLKKYTAKPVYCHLAALTGIILNTLCMCSIYWTVQGWRNVAFDLTYVGLSPVLWGIGWVLIIGSCHCHPTGRLNRFLSHSFWIPLSNLTYCCYLIHCIVVFGVMDWYAKSGINGPFLPIYSHLEMVAIFGLAVFLSYVSAGVLFIAVEAPSDSIRLWLMRGLIDRKQNKQQAATTLLHQSTLPKEESVCSH